MAAPFDESPLLIMMEYYLEYYRPPGGDVKKSSGRPRRGSLGEKPSRTGRRKSPFSFPLRSNYFSEVRQRGVPAISVL
jgi:hypothetical protein